MICLHLAERQDGSSSILMQVEKMEGSRQKYGQENRDKRGCKQIFCSLPSSTKHCDDNGSACERKHKRHRKHVRPTAETGGVIDKSVDIEAGRDYRSE
jgi:hypothetical protein